MLGVHLPMSNIHITGDRRASLVSAFTLHRGIRAVVSTDRVANIALASMAFSLPQRRYRQRLNMTLTRTESLWSERGGVACLPLVWHPLPIVVHEAVVEVELRVGQLGACVPRLWNPPLS